MEWTDKLHINAVSQWTSPTDNHFAFASVEGELCRINVGGADCFPNGTLVVKANAGAVVGDNYYYGRNVGKQDASSIYWVSGLGELNPTFHTDTNFDVRGSLIGNTKILDFAPLMEPDGEEPLIDDGVAGRSYLIGIGGGFEVFVAYRSTG